MDRDFKEPIDRHRVPGGDRTPVTGDDPRRPPPSRWSGDNNSPTDDHHRFPRGGVGGGGGGGGGGRFHPYRVPHEGFGGSGPGFRGGTGTGFGGGGGPMGGPKRGFHGGRGGGGDPEFADGNKFVKLFVGSVPRTATEEDIRPLFEEHGNVLEVAIIWDRKSGQQQGFCFVKYATPEEADRAIAALHHQYTLPGASAPLQVRYADSDRERQEDKLFVASFNKRATEQEIAEVFSPYGHVEDVYLMKDELRQSRGCGFVKFSNRENAAAAMNALHGTYVMRGCDQPLIVRFADPKRPRPEQRGGPAFGGPGFGRADATTIIGPPAKFGEPVGGRVPPNGWWPQSPHSQGPPSQPNVQGFGSNPPAKSGANDTSSAIAAPFGETGVPTAGAQLNFAAMPSQQGFNPPMGQMPPLQMPLMTPQNLPHSLQPLHNQQIPGSSNSQAQILQGPLMQQIGQLQPPQSANLPSNQTLPNQQLSGLSAQLSSSQPVMQQNANQQQGMAAFANQQQLPNTISPQLVQRPMQQMPSQLPQVLLQQQAQSLQSSVQSSQQAIFQLQQQLQLIQQSNQQQISCQNAKQQTPWSGQQPTMSTPASTTATAMPSAGSATSAMPVTTTPAVPTTCNWSEHSSPEGYKYYYNSVTRESRWEKPEEYAVFEQQQQQQKLLLFQQQQQKLASQQLQSSGTGSQMQIQPNQSIPQAHQLQAQMQLRQQAQMQLVQPNLAYPASGVGNHQNIQDYNYGQLQAINNVADTARVQQGIQAAPDLTWQNKPKGS